MFSSQSTEVRFASFLYGGFITVIVVTGKTHLCALQRKKLIKIKVKTLPILPSIKYPLEVKICKSTQNLCVPEHMVIVYKVGKFKYSCFLHTTEIMN